MDKNLNEIILDKLTKTCTCKLITRAKIKEAIKNGASTLEEVKKASRGLKWFVRVANGLMINSYIK